MVKWNQLQNATAPDNKPTPGWLFHEIVLDVRNSPKDVPDVAEYLMQCVCSDQLNVQLKAVLCVKHLAAEDITFQQYMQACPGALKILDDIAAPPIVPQARSLEPQEVKTVREATQTAIKAIHTPHTVEKSTESAHLKTRIQGFGNFEPPVEEQPAQKHGVAGQVAEFVGDSIGDMVDDFREKGAVGALKDATVDALDLVLDGVDAIWGWVAGKGEDNQPRICQPQHQNPAAFHGMPAFAASPLGPAPAAFRPQPPPTTSANHYAAAFGGVVGANNPVMLGPAAVPAAPAPYTTGRGAQVEEPKPAAPPAPPPAPVVDLLSMDEPAVAKAPVTADLLGDDIGGPAPAHQTQASHNMLDF